MLLTLLLVVKIEKIDQKELLILQTVRPAGETQNTKQTLLSDYGISSSPKAVKVEAGNTKLVEVKLEPGLSPKVGRLEDGRRGSEEGGKRKLTGCR